MERRRGALLKLDATLVTDGPSDRALLPALDWLLRRLTPVPVNVVWADTRLASKRLTSLAERIRWAALQHPCDLLLVHRDAEGQPEEHLRAEVRVANATSLPHVCVVPVRMTEAWLLHDETALREAASRPSGREPLDLPDPRDWESIPNPKGVLHSALRRAHGGKGRRAESFSPT